MTLTRSMLAAVLALGLGAGAAFAQSAPAPAAAAPAAAPAAPAAAPAMDKKAISKACSDEATQKGLHGKERKTYRSKCKMQKMKGM